jgi:hypothetical protein
MVSCACCCTRGLRSVTPLRYPRSAHPTPEMRSPRVALFPLSAHD